MTWPFFDRCEFIAYSPVILLIALGLYDNAFESNSILTPKRLYSLSIQGRAALQLTWRKDMLETPILRDLSSLDPDSPSPKMMATGCLNRLLKRLGLALGIEDPVTAYCFRRGNANALDGMYM